MWHLIKSRPLFYDSVSCIHPRVPGGSSFTSTSSPLPPPAPPAPAPHPETSPHSWVTAAADSSRLSSDEGDAEPPDDTERPTFHFSSRHPRPLGVSTAAMVLYRTTFFFIPFRLDYFSVSIYFNLLLFGLPPGLRIQQQADGAGLLRVRQAMGQDEAGAAEHGGETP